MSASPSFRLGTARAVVLTTLALAVVHTGGAAAGPLAEALARHAAADVAALRAHRDDVAARCTLGAIYARRSDLPRAALYLTGCADAALPDDVGPAVRAGARDVKRRLDQSRLAAISVVTQPEGLAVEIDALPGERFTAPATIWAAPGAHDLRALQGDRAWTRRVTTEPHKNTVVVIDTERGGRPATPRAGKVDFAEDAPGGQAGEHVAAPPPDIKHPSLLPPKYRGVPEPAAAPPIDDPMVKPRRRPPAPAR